MAAALAAHLRVGCPRPRGAHKLGQLSEVGGLGGVAQVRAAANLRAGGGEGGDGRLVRKAWWWVCGTLHSTTDAADQHCCRCGASSECPAGASQASPP